MLHALADNARDIANWKKRTVILVPVKGIVCLLPYYSRATLHSAFSSPRDWFSEEHYIIINQLIIADERYGLVQCISHIFYRKITA